ncbi:hypothetical protein BSKO_13133 [Bryopsis sp. KO-2023]|nr:hypothetical protein BSKO_13133 [Bryopsis sp. KO-2023]
MGDSITEGSVASIISAGTSVAMDDVIAQIETDKVTIDVRAPISGTLEAVKVQEGDTVLVGQAVAAMRGGKAPVAAPESSATETSSATPPPSRGGQGISFPVRRSPTGERISSMSIEKAQQILAELQGGPKPLPTIVAHPEPVPGPGKEQRKSDGFASWQPAHGGVKRRVLLSSEMEAIMLGGADP